MGKIKGTDISYWAIDYGKKQYNLKSELEFYNINLLTQAFDVVFFLDVLEHVPTVTEIKHFLSLVIAPQLLVRLPVSLVEGEPYFLAVSRNDSTHVQCHTKEWWITLFHHYKYSFRPLSLNAIYDSPGVLAGVFHKQ